MKIIKEIGRNPHLDWITILSLSLVIVVALAMNGYNLYNAVTSGNMKAAGTKKVATFTKLNEKAISAVISRFSMREEASQRARAGYTGVADPSL